MAWFEKALRRNVVDMHITDDDEVFLSRFDPEAYVAELVRARVQATVLFAHSHVGLCLFPSEVGPVHGGLMGRDLVGETLAACHREGLAVVLYLSEIFDTAAYRAHEDWRIRDSQGAGVADDSRYGVCCPNSPYRDYLAALAEEVSARYEAEGLRFDMTFWPRVCYCEHCRARFAAEVGGEPPTVVNWEDPAWVAFQRRREAWLIEFAQRQTDVVRRVRPAATVEHQASVFHGPWTFGVTWPLSKTSDFLQGDFYGDSLQGSFARKLFYNLSPARPAGFETSVSVALSNPVALKPLELLKAKASAALADGAAMVFIDSIDPAGTLNPRTYDCIGQVFEHTVDYEPFAGGEIVQDIAVFLGTESKFDPAENRKPVEAGGASGRTPHVDAAVSFCKTLRDNHVPFGVITGKNLGDLGRHSLVVLPNVLMMDEAEAEAVREYVRGGGSLYASGWTSLLGKDGLRRDDFLLADVFGVSWRGRTREGFTYVAPAEGAEYLFAGYTRDHPAGLPSPQMVAEARPGAEVLGLTVLPYTDPADPHHFASIHSDPPGRWTTDPAVVVNGFGDGRAAYVTADLESFDAHRDLVMNLVRMLGGPFSLEAEAPKCVEVTMFRQEERGRLLVSLVNFQCEMPNLPVSDVRVRVNLGGRLVRGVLTLPGETKMPFDLEGDWVTITVPEIETLQMIAIEA